MKITLLGTGTSQGVPVIACNCNVCSSKNFKDKRLRSSVLVETKGQVIVIDTGPDFRQQMLRENVQKLDAILFTHHHKDHVAGMDDIRAFNFKLRRDMDIYCNEATSHALHKEFPYVFTAKKYPGAPSVKVNIINNETFLINNIIVIPIRAMHYKLPVLGFRIDNFVYLTDVSFVSNEEKEKMLGADLIVLDALRKKEHISHFNLDQALSLLKELNPKKALLTHISHYMGLNDEVNSELPINVKLGFDGQKIILD